MSEIVSGLVSRIVSLVAGSAIALAGYQLVPEATEPTSPTEAGVGVLLDITAIPGGLKGMYSDGTAVMCFDNVTIDGECHEDDVEWR